MEIQFIPHALERIEERSEGVVVVITAYITSKVRKYEGGEKR